ncbi:cold shock domain-containing protein [Bacillus mycoides]|uniref:cold shock domain-containing protein n=1 Tax=Bacillus mycoides TaxID=1405 RepID=UPI0035CA8531
MKTTGVCSWFQVEKGYGFIKADSGEENIFVHHTQIYSKGLKNLTVGEPLEFELTIDPNGKKIAENVTGPNGASVQGK